MPQYLKLVKLLDYPKGVSIISSFYRMLIHLVKDKQRKISLAFRTFGEDLDQVNLTKRYQKVQQTIWSFGQFRCFVASLISFFSFLCRLWENSTIFVMESIRCFQMYNFFLFLFLIRNFAAIQNNNHNSFTRVMLFLSRFGVCTCCGGVVITFNEIALITNWDFVNACCNTY